MEMANPSPFKGAPSGSGWGWTRAGSEWRGYRHWSGGSWSAVFGPQVGAGAHDPPRARRLSETQVEQTPIREVAGGGPL